MKKVSIIIPVYNVEKYLRKCVDSVIDQTYDNIEIILVDDGSVDSCPSICDEYVLQDSRIKVIHLENGGAARARNIGIKESTGDYLAMVDADDLTKPEFIKTLVKALTESDADISACNYELLHEDGTITKRRETPNGDVLLSSSEAIIDHLAEDSSLGHVLWNKLYKKSLFTDNHIVIPEGDIYEDTRVLYKLYSYANKVAYINVSEYLYLQRPGSVMNDMTKSRNRDLLNIIATETAEWLRERFGSEYDKYLFVYSITGYMNTINYMLDRGATDMKIWRINKSHIQKNIFKIFNNDKISIKRKIACISCLFGYHVYKRVRHSFVKSMGDKI